MRIAGSLGLLGAVIVLVAFGLGVEVARADDASALELAVKATFLYKFQPFVTWPAQAFASATAPFTICVVGDDPFGPVLDRAVAGQQVGGHVMAVLRIAALSRDAHCQVVYIAPSLAQSARQIEDAVVGAPVLTVTDSMVDPAAKGIINFVVADNRVRFEIDAASARQDGLEISSKLLSLAVSVRPAP